MAIISTMLLLAYGAHVVLLLWHGQHLGMAELAYLIPMCLCLGIVWIWQSRHIPKYRDAVPLKMPRPVLNYETINEIISAHRRDEAAELEKQAIAAADRRQKERKTLSDIQEWQARLRRMQEGG